MRLDRESNIRDFVRLSVAGAAAVALAATWVYARRQWARTAVRPMPTTETAGPRSNPVAPLESRAPSTDGTTENAARRRRLDFPVWALSLLAGGLLFAGTGFGLMPPDESALIVDDIVDIAVRVDKRDAKVAAVLDATFVGNFSQMLSLYIYVDAPDGGVNWQVESTDPNGLRDLGVSQEVWTRQVQRSVPAGWHSYSDFKKLPDPRSRGLPGQPVAILGVKAPPGLWAKAGSHYRLNLPMIRLGESSTGSGWYQPEGEVVILPPMAIDWYRTDVMSPALSGDGTWRHPSFLIPGWSGTEPTTERWEERLLFVAGLLFGISGAAIIAGFENLVQWTRERRTAGRSPVAIRRPPPSNEE